MSRTNRGVIEVDVMRETYELYREFECYASAEADEARRQESRSRGS